MRNENTRKEMETMYKQMTDFLQEAKIGDFSLKKFEVTDNDFVAKIRCGISNGTYIKLLHKGEVVMSDIDMEKRTNGKFVLNAHGDILIGGLGIGMIILAIQDLPEVNSITVIEKYSEVIELVGKQLPLNKKVKIIQADVFDWKPEKGNKFNCIYMDIWNWINSDVYRKEMIPLTKKYAHYLVSKETDENRFNDCWCKKEARNNRRI